jgi:hypothetical protein
VIALLVAGYYSITGLHGGYGARTSDWKLWTTLRCGERFLGQDMSKYVSPVRPEVFDIGSAGCSNKQFWATFDEIREAAAQSEPPAIGRGFGEVLRFKLMDALGYAFGAFLLVNLVGFVVLGARSLFRWVRAGYR